MNSRSLGGQSPGSPFLAVEALQAWYGACFMA